MIFAIVQKDILSRFLGWQPRCQSYYRGILIAMYIVLPKSFYNFITYDNQFEQACKSIHCISILHKIHSVRLLYKVVKGHLVSLEHLSSAILCNDIIACVCFLNSKMLSHILVVRFKLFIFKLFTICGLLTNVIATSIIPSVVTP